MDMLSSLIRKTLYIFSILSFSVLSACGGGGGGGSAGPSYPNITYTGMTSAAVIDQTNADDFAFVVIDGSGSSQNVPFAASVNTTTAGTMPDAETMDKVSGVVSGFVQSGLGKNGQLTDRATTNHAGQCGGSGVEEFNDRGGSFDGGLTFDNYCEGGLASVGYELTLHGIMSFSGTYHMVSGNPVIDSMNINIQYLKITFNDGVSIVADEFSGSLAITFDGAGNPVSETFSVNYQYEGKVYRIENFSINEIAGTISATVYHPDYGYVDISTTSPFTYNNATEQFCDGSLQITGSDGAGGNVVVEFTDYSCSTYDICITVNADPQICSTGNNWDAESVWP